MNKAHNIFHYLLLVIILLFNSSVLGQSLITDRPDQTESSSTIPKGSLQIESGILLGFSEINNFSERQLLAPTTLFRYGISEGFELRITNQLEKIENLENSIDAFGIGDLELGFKIQLLKKDDINTEIAFLSHLTLPTGSKEISMNRMGTINKLSVSHSLNEQLNIGYNIGYNYLGNMSGDITYSLAWGLSINEKTGIYIEPYGEIVDLNNHQSNLNMGITYLLKKNFQLDFSFGTGLNNTMNYISAGLSINIKS